MIEKNLISSYVAFAQADENTSEYKDNFWAFDSLLDLCFRSPYAALGVIVEVLSQNPGPKVMRMLAAGPLEELLIHHGSVIIDQLEAQAKKNGQMAQLLGTLVSGRRFAVLSQEWLFKLI